MPDTTPNATTLIKDAGWLVAWDAEVGSHVYRQGVDVAFAGNRIVHVGPDYTGPSGRIIDGRGVMVMPGLVDAHTHPTTEPAFKGIREEHGVRRMGNSGLYERMIAYKLDEEGRKAAMEVAYAEMLASGVTTVVDLTAPFDDWTAVAAKSGMRAFLAPTFRAAEWRLEPDYSLHFDWDEAAGRRAFEAALALVDSLPAHPSGRLSGVIYPAQIETCGIDLFKDAIAAARERGVPITTHIAQSLNELKEIKARHGMSPIALADHMGLLGDNCLLAHAIFLGHHSLVGEDGARDIERLAETGTSIAHCPTPIGRYGHLLQDFGRYARAGINISIGTDVSPHNILEEMRTALIMARTAAQDVLAVTTSEVLTAATVGGARAMLRDDLGKIEVGAKADIVLVDLADPNMVPARDPLRSLIYTAAERAVRDVFVDGIQVVRDRRVLTLDRADAAARLAEGQQRMMDAAPLRDFLGRTADEITPISLPLVS
ncbi:MAG: amidohydrolase family protein [Acuticoccus sp.]